MVLAPTEDSTVQRYFRPSSSHVDGNLSTSNVRFRGGDPANIAIFGESAGAFSVNAQMASPLTRQLISKAIGESGGGNGRRVIPSTNLATAEKQDENFANFNVNALNFALFQRFGLHAGEAQKLFHATNDQEAIRASDDLDGMEFVGYTVWAWLEAQANTPNPAFRYQVDLATPIDADHPAPAVAFHSDELEYVFGRLDSRSGYTLRPADYRLSEQMQAYWTNFAKTGNPSGKDLPFWPNYTAKDGWQVQRLDAVTAARADEHRDRYLFFQKYWYK